ncbi:MAG: methyltransferase [Hymenobacter sp.]
MQMIFSPLLQQSICIAAKLKLADLVAQRPQTSQELAAQTGTNEDALRRVLRLLSSVGIFSNREDDTFDLTPIASLLRSDVPDSLYHFVIMNGEDWMWRDVGELMYSVRTGKIAHEKVHGMSSFEYFTANPETGAVFNKAMTSLSKGAVGPIVEAYDFASARKVVDIAGGHGILLAGVLHANPHVQGVLFDLPAVIAGAGPLLEEEGVANRVELVVGDFFEAVTAGADVYMMKHIIHDWDDALSIKILKNIRTAMPVDGKLLIVEMVVPEGNEPSPAKIMDVLMLAVEGGKERTAKEYQALLAAAGLKMTRIIPTKSPYSLVEAERM